MGVVAYSSVPSPELDKEIEYLSGEVNSRIVMDSISKDLLDILPNGHNGVTDMSLFLMALRAKEQKRTFDLVSAISNGIAKSIVVSGTYQDSVALAEYVSNIGLGSVNSSGFKDISNELYDVVIMFTGVEVDSSIKSGYVFSESKGFVSDKVRGSYGDKVLEFESPSSEEYKKRRDIYFGI